MLASVTRLPHAPGVYRFRGRDGRVLYVGRAVDLRRRVASYWGDLGDRRHLRAMIPRIERVEAVVCDSAHEAAWLERNLLEERRPVWNRSLGEEVPVYLRLDGRARSPGLKVVHRVDRERPIAGVTYFGPYLGSVRAQLAVSGLQRVLPVAYTADGLSGGQVDLARMLGMDRLDREAVLAALRGVLDRDPGPIRRVRQDLTARRDDAALALAFERAGQVQAELEALEWLVSEQKVTSMEPVGHDVAGWADGLLVRFTIRDGRLCTWTQRRCAETTARPAVEATPPAWAAFARLNTRLAVELA